MSKNVYTSLLIIIIIGSIESDNLNSLMSSLRLTVISTMFEAIKLNSA